MVFANGVCRGSIAGAADGVINLLINNVAQRTVTTIGNHSSGVVAGMPFSFTYASSTPNNTSIGVKLTLSGSGCDDGLADVAIDYLILPS